MGGQMMFGYGKKVPPMIPANVWNAIEETWRFRSSPGWEPEFDRSNMYLMCNSTITSSEIFGNKVNQSFSCPLNSYKNCKGSNLKCCWGLAARWNMNNNRAESHKAIEISKKIYNLIVEQRASYEAIARERGGLYLRGLQIEQHIDQEIPAPALIDGLNRSRPADKSTPNSVYS